MVSPLCVASLLTLGSYYEISGTVKLWVPPQHSWGVSYVALASYRFWCLLCKQYGVLLHFDRFRLC